MADKAKPVMNTVDPVNTENKFKVRASGDFVEFRLLHLHTLSARDIGKLIAHILALLSESDRSAVLTLTNRIVAEQNGDAPEYGNPVA